MLFILFSLLLFLGIAFFQSIQGTFSALIMLVLTILSAAVAVNFYAPISQNYLLEHIPDYADAASLAVLFTVTLVVLRSLADNFVRTNIVLWQWPDRILAGAISIPTSLLLVGISIIGFQMLPFDGQVMLFNRWTTDNDSRLVRSGIFPYADDFTNKVLANLSDGCLQNDLKFGMVHPDWPGEVSAQRIAVQRESKHAIPSGLVRVTETWKREGPLVVKEYGLGGSSYRNGPQSKTVKVVDTNRMPASGNMYLAARMELAPKAADGDGYHRFGWGQVRLVGFQGSDRTQPINYYAVGVRDPDFPAEFNYMRVKVKEPPPVNDDEAEAEVRDYGLVSREAAKGPMSFDVVFEVPEGFTPWFLEYKRWSRTPMPKIAEKKTEAEVKPGTAEEKKSVGAVASAGWHTEFQVDPKRTAFTGELPFKYVNNQGQGGTVELSGGKFVHGHLIGTVGGSGGNSLDSGAGAVVSDFDVPADKRLLRVECQFSPAGSSFIQGIFGAVQAVTQVKAVDTKGNPYFPVGKYVMLETGQGKRVELIYDVSPEAVTAQRTEPFSDIKFSDMRAANGRVGFLYLIPPGTELKQFEVGGKPFEIQTLQLKAPN